MTEKQFLAYEKLSEIDKKYVLIGHIEATVQYDFETVMSPRGGSDKSRQLSYLSNLRHEIATSREVVEALSVLEAVDESTDEQKALIRHWKKRYENEVLLPKKLVTELSEAQNTCQDKWFVAREDGLYDNFYPYLERLVELSKERASLIAKGKSLYDALLCDNDVGFDSNQISSLFSSMQETILDVINMVQVSDRQVSDSDQAFLFAYYDVEKQKEFSKKILEDMGFEFDRGAIGVVSHPFTTVIGSDDIRITTRFEDPNVTSQIFTIVHEAGHALYEMGANNAHLKGTSLAQGESNTFHESQSRLWENLVARSPYFWEHYYPIFCSYFPNQTKGVELDQFIRAVNRVACDDVRVNADEVTYGLHIILRYELEKQFIDSNLRIKDLPDAWNALSLKLLGKEPDSIKSGVLQDVHWMCGLFGYFPSYALGNIINAHIWNYVGQEINLNNCIKNGNLREIKNYLTDKYYRYGAVYPSDKLLFNATGKTLDASYFDKYLKDKYRRLFL